MVELCTVIVRQRILVLSLRQPAPDRDILPRLHEELHTLQLRDLWLQALDHCVNAVTLVEWLQLENIRAVLSLGLAAGNARKTYDA